MTKTTAPKAKAARTLKSEAAGRERFLCRSPFCNHVGDERARYLVSFTRITPGEPRIAHVCVCFAAALAFDDGGALAHSRVLIVRLPAVD